MQNLIERNKNKINILLLVFSPLIVAVCNVCMVSLLNLGRYFGTFGRHLFNLVIS